MTFESYCQYITGKYNWIKRQLARHATLYYWNGNESIPIYSIDYVKLWWNAITFNETDDFDNEIDISVFTINGKIRNTPIIWEDPLSVKEYWQEKNDSYVKYILPKKEVVK